MSRPELIKLFEESDGDMIALMEAVLKVWDSRPAPNAAPSLMPRDMWPAPPGSVRELETLRAFASDVEDAVHRLRSGQFQEDHLIHEILDALHKLERSTRLGVQRYAADPDMTGERRYGPRRTWDGE